MPTCATRRRWHARGRSWHPGLEHRIGGLEKQDVTGEVNYEPANHEHMVKLRADKVRRIANDIPDVEVVGNPNGGDLLVLGWGSTRARSPAPSTRRASAAGT